MIRINQIKMQPGHSKEQLQQKVSKLLRIAPEEMEQFSIVKQSIDARKKPDIILSYVIEVACKNEESVVKRANNNQISVVTLAPYVFPAYGHNKLQNPPIIIGSGPAGLFCAYQLAIHGYQPILLEKGEEVSKRKITVEQFWETGELNESSNVQFGEGGAGTFSDGKLNTLVKDKFGRNTEVLKLFVEAGAPEAILYENKPHIGTDILITVVKNMRNQIINHGGKVLFQQEVTDFILEENQITGVEINHKEIRKSNVVVLAIGHSARSTFELLYERKVQMEAKSFAVGLRVEHSQEMINQSQYGMKDLKDLPVAAYKVTAQPSSGRGVYSFCMCPGGYVVNASSERGKLAINGMSYSKRDSLNANSAIIVSVTPEDFGSDHPLAGISYQRELEKMAYELCSGKVPVQYYDDFVTNKASVEQEGRRKPCIKGEYEFTNVRSILPASLQQSFIDGMEQFNRVLKGFTAGDTLVSGIESRTSSPVRILRDESFQCNKKGLYPCGEGAGYAGGITSAAMDGIRVAEEIGKIYAPY